MIDSVYKYKLFFIFCHIKESSNFVQIWKKNEEKMSYSTYLQPISRLILQLPESITKCFFSPLTGYFCMYDFVVVIKTKNKTCYYIDTFLARMKSHSWPYNLNIKKSNTKCLFFKKNSWTKILYLYIKYPTMYYYIQ